MTIGYFLTSGFSTTNMELCANMHHTSLSANPNFSGSVFKDWNTDIAIAKIAAYIPIEYAFPYDGQLIQIGYCDEPTPTLSAFTSLGYVFTKTSGTILAEGEWQPLTYTEELYTDKYEYLTNPTRVYAYTTELIRAISGDVTVSGEYLTEWPTSTAIVFLGQFTLRLFYDKVNYGNANDEPIIIDVSANNQEAPITRNIPANGFMEVRWLSGEYNNLYVSDSTMFCVSSTNEAAEYYGDRNNNIKLNVDAGDIINLYIHTYEAISPISGSVTINYYTGY